MLHVLEDIPTKLSQICFLNDKVDVYILERQEVTRDVGI